MNSSNNNSYVLKCYINLFNIVPDVKESSPQFNCPSYANKLYTNYSQHKKNYKKILLMFLHIIGDELNYQLCDSSVLSLRNYLKLCFQIFVNQTGHLFLNHKIITPFAYFHSQSLLQVGS